MSTMTATQNSIRVGRTSGRVTHERSAAAQRQSVRLTARGRRAVVLLVVCVVAAAAFAASALASGSGQREAVVRPGQTLSHLAHEELPGLPIGEAVARLQHANGLNSLEVATGQRIIIPVG